MTNATSDDNDVQCMQSTRIENEIKNNQRMSCRKFWEYAIQLAPRINKRGVMNIKSIEKSMKIKKQLTRTRHLSFISNCAHYHGHQRGAAPGARSITGPPQFRR